MMHCKIGRRDLYDLDKYHFTFLPMGDFDILQNDWLMLESKSSNYFFLSWAWIGTWIKTYSPDIRVLRAYYNGEMVAIAAFVLNAQRRHCFLHSRTLHLHQTGNAEKDQIWIEYNGILAKRNHVEGVTAASIRYLIEIADTWDELIIGAITEDEALVLEQEGNLMRHNLWEAPCYGIDLKTIRSRNKDYLSTLSRNTRYQIKRSIRLYQQNGKIIIETADNLNTAIKYLKEIGPLHIDRWGTSCDGSGFTNQNFTLFHENLIKNCWDSGIVDIFRIRVGNRVIAMFYNFIYKNRVYFYLSGLVSEMDSKLKPGLTGHSLCIQKYIDDGLDFYDFMGGSERYKKNLASKHQQLVKVTLQKRKLKFKLEMVGRKIKSKMHFYPK